MRGPADSRDDEGRGDDDDDEKGREREGGERKRERERKKKRERKESGREEVCKRSVSTLQTTEGSFRQGVQKKR